MKRLMTIIVILGSGATFLPSCSKSENMNTPTAMTTTPSPSPSVEPTRPKLTPKVSPLPTPEPIPTPKPVETTVRLRVVDSNGEIASGVAFVFLESDDENTVSAGVTDYNGLASYDVPCNRNWFIHLWQYGGTRDRFENTHYQRYIKCRNEGVDLGNLKIKCICPDCKSHRDRRGSVTKCV